MRSSKRHRLWRPCTCAGTLLFAILIGTLWAAPSARAQAPAPRAIFVVARATEPKVEILADAWPGQARPKNYEYNQKNHHEPPDFIQRETDFIGRVSSKAKSYRVIGVRCANTADEEIELQLKSPQLERGKKLSLAIPPRTTLWRHFVIQSVVPSQNANPLVLELELGLKTETPTAVRLELPPALKETRNLREAMDLASELDAEDRARLRLAPRAATVSVRDDMGEVVPKAQILLLQENGLMVYEGQTDASGMWSGFVIPGAYTAYAFKELEPPPLPPDATTAVEPVPRLLALRSRLAESAGEVELRATRTVDVLLFEPGATRNAAPLPLKATRVWLTFTELFESYRHDVVAKVVGERARLETRRSFHADRVQILAGNFELEVCFFCEPDGPAPAARGGRTRALADDTLERSILLRQRIAADGLAVEILHDPARAGRVRLAPRSGFGPGLEARLKLVAADGMRETLDFRTQGVVELEVAPGRYRYQLTQNLEGGGALSYLPDAVVATAGTTSDISAQGPWSFTLYYQRVGKKLQFYLALSDARGRVLASLPNGPGKRYLRPDLSAEPLAIEELRWEMASGIERVDVEALVVAVEIPIGTELVRERPRIEKFEQHSVAGAGGTAPRVFAERLKAILGEFARCLAGSRRFLNLPVGGTPHMQLNFDIFLPPGVGGLGGGGTITLDLADLFYYTSATDPLPGAFLHELGHNLGFGHDPYMLLAPAGADEERYGSFGYRMLNATAFQRALGYLDRLRVDDRAPWQLDDGVFAALRLLFGPEVHVKMFQERKVSEKTLVLHGLSSIERIATLYSLAVEQNVAWVFRALGWPVFDDRVELGAHAVRVLRKHPPQLNYERVDGTPLSAWWLFGPVVGNSATPADAESPPTWTRSEWPTRFVALDAERPPAETVQRYLLYRKVKSAEDADVQFLIASDVQLEVRVNDSIVASIDASPQQSQPLHDEMMLNQKRPYTAHLFRGENHIEVGVIQPPGARGFTFEFITPAGKPYPLELCADAPVEEGAIAKTKKLKPNGPIFNGSFELGGATPTAWIPGPIEGALKFALDDGEKVEGKRSLRATVESSARGGTIQRITVEPGKRYLIRAAMRSKDFAGQAYVSFFSGDVHAAQARTTPLETANSPWQRFEYKWFSGASRCVYVACYVTGSRGTVWFDTLEMVETK
ncbi:MAG: hypothetical protein ACKVX7_13560 [Planctomycetota bacterium]